MAGRPGQDRRLLLGLEKEGLGGDRAAQSRLELGEFPQAPGNHQRVLFLIPFRHGEQLPPQRQRFLQFHGDLVEVGQALAGVEACGMVLREKGLADRQRLAHRRRGRSDLVDHNQVQAPLHQGRGDGEMAFAVGPALQGDQPARQGLRAAVVLAGVVDRVQRSARIQVIRGRFALLPLPDGRRPKQGGLRLGEAFAFLAENAELVQPHGDKFVVGAVQSDLNGKGLAEQRFGLLELLLGRADLSEKDAGQQRKSPVGRVGVGNRAEPPGELLRLGQLPRRRVQPAPLRQDGHGFCAALAEAVLVDLPGFLEQGGCGPGVRAVGVQIGQMDQTGGVVGMVLARLQGELGEPFALDGNAALGVVEVAVEEGQPAENVRALRGAGFHPASRLLVGLGRLALFAEGIQGVGQDPCRVRRVPRRWRAGPVSRAAPGREGPTPPR